MWCIPWKTLIRPETENKEQTFIIDTTQMPDHEYLADMNHLRDILINILSNATKYTDRGGSIAMRVRSLSNTGADVDSVCFEVEDNGRGMSEEFQEIIFDPFSREHSNLDEKERGAGLGMASYGKSSSRCSAGRSP